MGFLFPWTNLHEINLDWLIDRVKHIPTKTSQLINDSGYITLEQASPVQSVNGQTGAVVLTAADVGAKPDSYAAPVDSVNGQTGAVVLTAADVGAKPDSYAAPVDSVNGKTGDILCANVVSSVWSLNVTISTGRRVHGLLIVDAQSVYILWSAGAGETQLASRKIAGADVDGFTTSWDHSTLSAVVSASSYHGWTYIGY